MNSLKIISLTASLVLATIFTFSCSGDDGNGEEKFSYCIKDGFCHEGPYTLEGCSSFGGMPSNNCPNGGGGGSSSSGGGQGGGSSSSGGGSPSSSSVGGNGDDGSEVAYEGQTYRTVKIGTQTWFAENLNYAATGSKCYGEGGEVSIGEDENYNPIRITLSPAEVQTNCVKYGRLYDWATAMGLSPSCNEGSCSSQIQPKHKGICPSGWHLPSKGDWDALITAVGDETTAGTKLKATSGWSENDNGTDQYGFSALPGGGGIGSLDDSFYFGPVGSFGGWWSASESEYKNYDAYYLIIENYDENTIFLVSNGKVRWFSVRCIKDN
jgi:uncharacterized protein (TIGR02145 family)